MTARILVVDDIYANVKLLQSRLTTEGYDSQALNVLESSDIDLILLDVMMPGMDGLEVCRILKLQESTRHVPVIMVTALEVSERARGIEAGADDVLMKPVDELELMARLRNLIEMRLLDDELFATDIMRD